LAVPYFYRHVDDTIRARVETLFASTIELTSACGRRLVEVEF
jgi:hypothetical protein